MAVKDINDLYQQLSADENFNGLFNSPEDFASTMQNMSSERQQAFYDKVVSGSQISNVDFSNVLKKKDEANSTFESLSVGSKPGEPVQKIDVSVPEMPIEAEPTPLVNLGAAEVPVGGTEGVEGPIDPRQKVKNAIIGITNEINNNPTGNWSQQYQELLKDPDYLKYGKASDIQKEFGNIYQEWSRLSKNNRDLKQKGEEIGLVPKQEPLLVEPAPKSVAFKKPETLTGRLYADSVAADKRKKDQMGQSTRPMFIESDNTISEVPDPNKLIEADQNTKKSIERFKQDPSTLYNAISGKRLKYYTPQGQEITFDEYALGSLLFNHTKIELQDANGPLDLSDLTTKNRKNGLSFLDEELFKKNLIQNGFPEYKVEEEVERLKTLYLQQRSAHNQDQIKNKDLVESGGNQSVANVKFLNRYNEEGRELLTDDEQEAYAIVNQLDVLYQKVANAQAKNVSKAGGTLSTLTDNTNLDMVTIRKQMASLQTKLSAIRDNPNNLYDWRTGEFIDTRISSNKPKVEQIKKENKEFQIKYASTPKGDLTRLRNTLLSQREVIISMMDKDGIEVPEAGTFGSFYAKLQTSAARTSGTYSITLPSGLSMDSKQYEKKVDEYQKQLLEVERNLFGINRALMLNENVLLKDQSDGFFEKLGEGILTAGKSIGREFIPGAGEGDARADWEIRNSLLMLMNNGYVISPELKSLARKSVGEQIFDSAGMLVDAMVQISMGNIAIPEIAAMKWAKKMGTAMKSKYGRAGEVVFENTTNAIRQGGIFQAAGQGFATGVGEAFGQAAYEAMKLDRLFVNKGRLLPFLTRSILGGTGEIISEYAGQYLQVLAENGINAKDNFKKAFGHDAETGLDQLLVIGITSTMFSGAANIKILTATSSTLQNILNNPQSAAAYGDVLDEDKRKEIEEVLKVVNDKLHDRQARKVNNDITKDKSEGYQEPLTATERTQQISDLQEKRKADIEKIYDNNTITDETDKQNVDALVDEVNQKYDDQVNSFIPKTTEFESLTGNNSSAIVAGSDLNAPHVIDFLANIPSERNRKAAAEMIAIAQKANNTLQSVLPQATIIMHDKKSFADKMAQRGISDSRKGNFTIHKSDTGAAEIEIQINVEDGSFEDIAHEVTHGIVFNKFYNNDARVEEINNVKDSITESPKELTDKIAEINKKYDKEFSDTLGKFRDDLTKVASESQSKYLDDFVKGYDENSSAEEYIVEFAALLAKNGQRLEQEDPNFFKRLLALFNKLVKSIGGESKIKLQEFTDTQEVIDFMNNVSSAIRGGTTLESTPIKQKTTKTTETTEKVNLKDKARNTPEKELNDIYNAFPELTKIGTPKEYSEYLDSVFPTSKIKDIVYNMNEGVIKPVRDGSFGYGYYFLSKRIADLFTSKETNVKNAVILNMQTPLNLEDDKQYNTFIDKYGLRAVSALFDNDNDSVIRNKYKTSNVESKEYYVMEPEQIHQLGSKEDIKDFEKFIDSKKIKQQKKLINQEKELDNLFNEFPELKNIGSKEEYAQYLKSIFPKSKVKEILYHGTSKKFEKFEKEKLGKNTGAPSATLGFFFATGKDTGLSYIGNQFTEYQKEYEDYRNEYEKVIDAKRSNKKELLLALDNYTKKLDTLLQKILVFLKLSATKQKYKKTINEIVKLTQEIDKLTDLHFDRITEDIDVYLQKTNQVVDDIIKTYIKPREGTSLLRVVVDIKNPGLHNDQNQGYREESYYNRIQKDLSTGRDGTIIENTEDWGGSAIYNEDGLKNVPTMETDVVAVYEPEQIHILGTEKDLEEFKNFVETESDVNVENNIKEEVNNLPKSNFSNYKNIEKQLEQKYQTRKQWSDTFPGAIAEAERIAKEERITVENVTDIISSPEFIEKFGDWFSAKNEFDALPNSQQTEENRNAILDKYKSSKLVDENMMPVLLLHGTKQRTELKQGEFFLGKDVEFADSYGNITRIGFANAESPAEFTKGSQGGATPSEQFKSKNADVLVIGKAPYEQYILKNAGNFIEMTLPEETKQPVDEVQEQFEKDLLTPREPLGLKPEEEEVVYNVIDDEKGNLYEQKNLNIEGSFSIPFKASNRLVDKARIEIEIDGIAMKPVDFISPETSRNKKYNATMSDHTKVGSYVNPRTGAVVKNLFGGFLFSYIAENFDNGVVWASTGIKQARDLVLNSARQDKTVIYRMNRASGSKGNDNFATIALEELLTPVKNGLVSEEEMLDLINERLKDVKIGKIILSKKYSTGADLGSSKIKIKGADKITKEVTVNLKAFASMKEFKQAILGGGKQEKLAFATRGIMWDSLLYESLEKTPNLEYFKKLNEWGVTTIAEINDLIAEPLTDNANDADIVGALKIDAPEMISIIDQVTGKPTKVPKIWTPFLELVNESQGIFYTKGVKHVSYPYVVKGKPLGVYTEFHSVTEYFPIIKEWMSRTLKSQGFLTKNEFLAKNADDIKKAKSDYDRATTAYEEIKKNKDIPKETKELLAKEMKKYDTLYKKSISFTPRLTSAYKAIETMHGELMRNFDSTAELVPTGRKPLVSGILPMDDKGRVEPWSTPQQEITSAGTSINKAKLPSVYSDKAFFNILKNVKGDKITIVDVGSGKYANVNIKPLLERGEISDLITEGSRIKLSENAVPRIQEVIASKQITYLPYDPFNQPSDINENTINQVKGGGANIAISPNVLNVIAEAEAREGVIANLADAVGDSGTAIIQIYEGEPKDRGNGKVTKTGGENSWQNNQPTSWYVSEVQKYFANVKFANKIIIADNKVFEDKARVSEKALEAKSYGVPQRYKGDVGKFIGGDLYVHKSAMDVFPQKEFELAESKLPEDFDYEIVKYNAVQGSFSFIASPDWNSANEPIVGDSYKVSSKGEVSITKQKSDPQIYHHKWNFVRDNYEGFNVRQSVQRSIDWYRDAKDEVNIYKIGTKSYWNQNAEPLIKNTILNLEDKGRRQDDIQNEASKIKQQYPSINYDTLGQKLVAKGYTLGEIKRFIPELAKFYQKEAVNKFNKAIKTTQGKINQRQKDIRQEMVKNANLSYTTLYDSLRDSYEDFELYKAFYEEGADPSELDELFGTDYRQTIQNYIGQKQDGKTVLSPDLMREIRQDARARKMVNVADQMMNVFAELGDISSAEEIINAAADSLEEGFIEGAMKQVTDEMRRKRKEIAEGVDQLRKISKGELSSDTIIDVSKLLSIAGRILQTGRGLTETQEGLEKLIFNSLEIVEYRPGKDVIRKHRVFKLTPGQRQKISTAIKTYRESSQAFKNATKALEEGPDMYTDEAFSNFDKAKAQIEKDSRNLKVILSAYKRVGFGNWFTSMTALGLLSLRTLTIGIVGNVEMQLASMPKSSKIGKIFGWGRILADKLVKNFSQVGSKSGINEFVARGVGTSVDTSVYKKMAFAQGKQQIINIMQNTVADASTSNSGFMENQAVMDSNQELKKSFKMFGKLLVNLLPTSKKLTDEDWANAFDKLLLLMNEKDENGEYKLANQNPKGYQAATTFLRGVFGSIPQATGKAISLSGDRVFFKYGYYHSLTAYANFMGITNPREIQRFIRLNSVPGTNADAMARRAGDYRIFQSDNKLVKGMSTIRGNIAKAEENLAAKSLVLKTQGKGSERFSRVYPAKFKQLGYKLGAVMTSPFTRIPSNVINIAVQKTIFPISFGDYIIKQSKLREKIREYDDLFDLDKNATMSKTKLREMESMRLEIFELQTKTQKALSNSLQAMQVFGFAALLVATGAASAPYGDDEDEKARARAAGIAQQPSGSINFTHFWEVMTGQANKYRVTKKGDVIMSYTNFGLLGFGLSGILSLGAKMKGKENDQKNIIGSEEESSFGWDLVFESLSNGITNLSFIQNVVALASAVKGEGNAVENLGVNLTKTLLTVPTLSFGVFGAVEKAEGVSIDPMRNYVPELETQDGAMSRFQARVITSLTGKSPLTWFGLKDETGKFYSKYASQFYRPQIGPHGEELYKKNTFWDIRAGDWVAAYVQASFDPFSFHDYEGFVSMIKPYEKGSDYKKGDIIQTENGVYAVLKDLKNFDLKSSNTNENDLDVKYIEEKEKYFNRENFISNQEGTQYSQSLFDLLNIYQQTTGDNKPFKVMSRLYDPYIKAKDKDGEISIYIPEKYFRELGLARGKVARNAYSLQSLQSTIERIYRAEDEKLFDTDSEYKEFVQKEIETLFNGSMNTNYDRSGGIEDKINTAIKALEDSEEYKKITRLVLLEGLKSEKYTEEEYIRLSNAEGISPFILGIPKDQLKFKK